MEKTQAGSYGVVHWEVELTSFISYTQEITVSIAPVVKCLWCPSWLLIPDHMSKSDVISDIVNEKKESIMG